MYSVSGKQSETLNSPLVFVGFLYAEFELCSALLLYDWSPDDHRFVRGVSHKQSPVALWFLQDAGLHSCHTTGRQAVTALFVVFLHEQS